MSTESNRQSKYANHKNRLIEILSDSEDGLSIADLSKTMGLTKPHVRELIDKLIGKVVYIDRWIRSKNNQWAAIYMAVKCPEDCPKPE